MENKGVVMVFVDYENIRRGLADNFQERVGPDKIIEAISNLAQELGDFRGGIIFGDWTLRPDDARIIEEHGLQAYNVLLTRGGKDRSDPPMMLEMYDVMHERPEINTFLVCSGDSGFKEIIRRGKERGKLMYICAVGLTIAREFITMSSGVFALEQRLGLSPKIAPTIFGTPFELTTRDWKPFIRRLDSLEKNLPFVAYNYSKNSILEPSMGCGDTKDDKKQFLEDAVSANIIELYELPNPKLAGRMTLACRLRRDEPTVKTILSQK